MAETTKNQVQNKENKEKIKFIVSREFAGGQSMREAFEQIMERQVCGHFEEWMERKAG